MKLQTRKFNAKLFYIILLIVSKKLITFTRFTYVECFTLVGCWVPTKPLSNISTFWETALLMIQANCGGARVLCWGQVSIPEG